jgi:hypothetical protein
VTEKKPSKKSAAWHPPAWDIPDAKALQQLAIGEASPEQQKRALKWIVETACGTYEMSYRPESARDSDFAEGRRFPGLQMVKLLKINLAALMNATKDS